LLVVSVLLSACGSLQRDEDAAAAKTRMIGMTREEVLACMGPPRAKSSEDSTQVWSYFSSDRQSSATGNTFRPTGYSYTNISRSRNFCTVNVVMKDGVVEAIHYLGPTSTNFYNKDDQCGYAVKACVEG
jgi:outer membrane protein assembly factor BamE (lipoprotein component of BamABCDE complex)